MRTFYSKVPAARAPLGQNADASRAVSQTSSSVCGTLGPIARCIMSSTSRGNRTSLLAGEAESSLNRAVVFRHRKCSFWSW
jgi:hypothetical protein